MPIATAGRSGSLDLGFARDPAGRTYLRRQHATHPFHVCRAQYLDRPRSGQATVYLQSCSGGLFRGDRHQVTIACDPGARAHVTTQASTVVHRADGDPARQAVALAVGAGAVLEYCPDPAILFPGAGLVNRTRVTLAPGAAALLWDACLGHDPGGAGAPFDRLDTDVQVLDDRGRLRAADRMAVTGAAFAAGTVGVMGPATCLGTVML
ncbi:MAG: urease accessory protein UreD, partial [Rhodobacterales bacterium]|nr:urease accessory protein UreD [Rhodobacterales bacterium]